MGIIDPEKYSFKSFEKDQPTFKKLYKDFVLGMGSEQMNYHQWLEMNNYGLLSDTKESILDKTSSLRSAYSKRKFLRTVNTGDILISSRSHSGLVGHAAIMVTDYWILEMAGGRNWKKGIKSNNRQISKDEWYDENCDETITVYRVPDSEKAQQAAVWVDRNYFNPIGGQDKDIHITYKLSEDFKSMDHSYSSKLVLHAYYYGTNRVIKSSVARKGIIAPTKIPDFFKPRYELERIKKFQA